MYDFYQSIKLIIF